MGRKIGGGAVPVWGEIGPHPTQCGLGWGLPPYQVESWCMQPFDHNRHGPKSGGAVPIFFFFFWGGGWLVRHWTQCLLGRGLYLPTKWHLIRPAVCPQQTWAENWGVCPFWRREERGPHPTQCGLGRWLSPYQVPSWSVKPGEPFLQTVA